MTVDLEALKADAEILLCARDVRDVDSYGWLDLERKDPDFLGYVMWVENPPYDHDVMGWQSNIPPKTPPTPQEQSLMEFGHDFFGLMKTSRHFIGQALVYQPHTPPMEIESTEFDFSEFAALVALIGASDRLRDFLITATSGRKKRTNEKTQREASFAQLESVGLAPLVAELRTGFLAADRVREARNDAVHRVSTKPARVQRHLIERDRAAHEAKSWGKPESGSYEEMVQNARRRIDEERTKIEERAHLLCDTYIALVKLGEVGFRAEQTLRQRRQSSVRYLT